LGVTLNESTRQKDVNSVFHDGLILIPGFRPFAFVFSSLGPHSTSCARSFTWELCRTCGGTLSGSGQIRSPYHPNPYPHSKTCEWVITQSPGQVVTFSFESFDIEGSSTCSFDYVELRDGTSVSSPLIGKYCGTQMPPAAQSTQRSMYVRFVTDSSVSNHGFTAQYAAIMEQTFTNPTGQLTSPNYPNNYPVYRECIYRIIVSVNRQIMLNFTDFALEPTYPSCLYDYVEIRDGGYETSPLTSRYCGTTTPPIIMSHSNRLWIKFRSDMTSTYRGFMAHWDGTLTGTVGPSELGSGDLCCGGTLTTSSGSFTSPNYPLPYHPNSECYWILQASGGSQEELRFEVFHLESSTNCNYDFLEVSGSNSPLLAKLCGNQIPAPIRSSRENLYVKLRTDASIGAGGFVAVYSQASYENIRKQNQMSSSVSVCQGVVIRGLNRGVLESPNYPGLYPHSKHCNWTIEATVGNTVNYTFTAFSMEPYCNYDYVKVNGGPERLWLAQLCHPRPPDQPLQVSSTGNFMTIRFKTDEYVQGKGFNASCGGVFTAPAGELHSPNFPSPYPPNVDCSWVLNVDRGHRVLLTFNEFEIENHNACNYDYLVYDGPDANAPLLGKLCGLNMPAAITATQSTMYIRFRSDSSFNHKGFSTAAMSLELHSRSFDI
uniref:CUB domain-containing protein n=1 Tax=Erpetoichthys calabaricus TaxID=27687 RepID=A0A8C4TM96_ERPCA